MYEKFSSLDIDSAGGGGEYTVQVTYYFPSFLGIAVLIIAVGWVWLDERSSALDHEYLWSYSDGSSVPSSVD